MKFRKKPVVIEAIKYLGRGNFDVEKGAIPVWMWEAFEQGIAVNRNGRLIIKTLEGDHLVSDGDWIIQGINGELYPCKPDIFAATYESEGAQLEAQLSNSEPVAQIVDDLRYEAGHHEKLGRQLSADALKRVAQKLEAAGFVRFAAHPVVSSNPIKDHVIAQTVNELRDIAIQFHGAQQLRERIAHVIVPLLKAQSVVSKGAEDK